MSLTTLNKSHINYKRSEKIPNNTKNGRYFYNFRKK